MKAFTFQVFIYKILIKSAIIFNLIKQASVDSISKFIPKNRFVAIPINECFNHNNPHAGAEPAQIAHESLPQN